MNTMPKLGDIEDAVLNSIADDYEEIFQILKDVRRWSEIPNAISVKDIEKASRSLITSGLAGAYDLQPTKPHVRAVSITDEYDLKKLWFYASKEGLEYVRAHAND